MLRTAHVQIVRIMWTEMNAAWYREFRHIPFTSTGQPALASGPFDHRELDPVAAPELAMVVGEDLLIGMRPSEVALA